MICEVFNEMGKFVDYTFNDNLSYKDEIKLWEVVLMTIMFLITILCLSWWILPIRFVFKKYGNITFYCKNRKGE